MLPPPAAAALREVSGSKAGSMGSSPLSSSLIAAAGTAAPLLPIVSSVIAFLDQRAAAACHGQILRTARTDEEERTVQCLMSDAAAAAAGASLFSLSLSVVSVIFSRSLPLSFPFCQLCAAAGVRPCAASQSAVSVS
jgi:hypothetical protein